MNSRYDFALHFSFSSFFQDISAYLLCKHTHILACSSVGSFSRSFHAVAPPKQCNSFHGAGRVAEEQEGQLLTHVTAEISSRALYSS